MTIEEFNKKYDDKGGLYKLSLMRSQLRTIEEIGNNFRVSKERVRQWMKEFFNQPYDPRHERRKMLINEMVESIKSVGIIETKKKYNSGHYIKLAIKAWKKIQL